MQNVDKPSFFVVILVLFSFMSINLGHAQKLDSTYSPKNLGKEINSRYSEISPFISPDGRELFFTRAGHPENNGYAESIDAQDTWYAYRLGDTAWSEAIRLLAPFNLRRYNTVEHFSADGNSLYIRGYFKGQTYVPYGLRRLQRHGQNWIVADTIDIPGVAKKIKGAQYGMCISPDNQFMIIYFSNNPITEQEDLWISKRKPDDTWTEPQSLGKAINTKYDESTPYIAADGRTLYFSSNRPGGWGSYDIYMSKRMYDTSWLYWTEPINLSFPINTFNWNAYFRIDAYGEYAYLVTKSFLGEGKEDIYKVLLPDSLRPNPVIQINGRVIDKVSKQGLDAEVQYQKLSGAIPASGIANVNQENGQFYLSLVGGHSYQIYATKEGYLAETIGLRVDSLIQSQSDEMVIEMVPIKSESRIELKEVFFDVDKSELRAESLPELQRLYAWLNSHPTIRLRIEGHTSHDGDDDYNLLLSQKRAEAVKEYLVMQGIAEVRLKAVGYGESRPRINSTTLEDEKNRRVEIIILGE
jgi:OOP family OmpA-OmpF porin